MAWMSLNHLFIYLFIQHNFLFYFSALLEEAREAQRRAEVELIKYKGK